ncbi:hypothetical protein HYC85_007170 [Camellia sinensis]|uniref:Potassium transporter n=1 Tax=Camellia sinensis TaxID=4442 RepID=A0A7J7HQN3_CAMSI|nr:hypothetical protein HYC85_007170 [Camellia sinensis]
MASGGGRRWWKVVTNLKKLSCSAMLTLAYQSLGLYLPTLCSQNNLLWELSLHEDGEEIYSVFSFIFWTFTVIALFKYIYIYQPMIMVKHYGTHRVAFMFAPIVTAWLLCIGGIGTYNIIKWNLHIFHALSPVYMLKFLRSTGIEGWVYLGGVVLSITGVDAMFADLGHFSTLSMMIAFTFLVYPCLVLAYLGEAAFLSRHHEDIQRKPISWPVFIVATFAAMIGSWAVISATFSIISQCCALNCFPLVKIVHTSNSGKSVSRFWVAGREEEAIEGLVSGCFKICRDKLSKRTEDFADCFPEFVGLAVTSVMFVTTCLMAMVMLIVCKQNIVTTFAFLAFFGSVELLYLSAALYEVLEGGWIPLVLSSIFMAVMFLWNYGTLKKHQFDMENKVLGWIPDFQQVVSKRGGEKHANASVTSAGGWVAQIRSDPGKSDPNDISDTWQRPEDRVDADLLSELNAGRPEAIGLGRDSRSPTILSLGPSLGMVRVPGIGLVYTNLMTGVPAIFRHFVTNLPAFHQVVVFICIKSVQVPYVNEKERFLISMVGPKEYGMFRCVVRYGYKDLQQENYDFENRLVCMIIKFVEKEGQDELQQTITESSRVFGNLETETHDSPDLTLTHLSHEEKIVHSLQDFHVMGSMNGRLEDLTARESGIAYILGHSYAQAKKSSSIFKKLAIGVVYAF